MIINFEKYVYSPSSCLSKVKLMQRVPGQILIFSIELLSTLDETLYGHSEAKFRWFTAQIQQPIKEPATQSRNTL